MTRISWIRAKSKNSFAVLAVAVGVVAVIALGLALYFYMRVGELNWQILSARPGSTDARAVQDVRDLVSSVSRHMVLPEDEEPTIATVTDPALLKDQPFFARAKAGFKVLIYPKAKRAILYDPTADKIIDVGPVGIKANE